MPETRPRRPGLRARNRRHRHLWRVALGDLSWLGLIWTRQQSQASTEDQNKLQITIFRPAIETWSFLILRLFSVKASRANSELTETYGFPF